MVLGGEAPLDVAVESIRSLFCDFLFSSEGDRSRAYAALITPALKQGDLLKRCSPMTLVEADQSQTGKGYFLESLWAVYGESTHIISQKQSSVGKIDEALDRAMLGGKPFISVDNVRGVLDSQHLEATLTCPGSQDSRIAYKPGADVIPRSFNFQATSNGMVSTKDLTNRFCVIRLLHQPDGYEFKKFSEGDLKGHIQANQTHYLGCVFAQLLCHGIRPYSIISVRNTG